MIEEFHTRAFRHLTESQPDWLQTKPLLNANTSVLMCHEVVRQHVVSHGGTQVFGWVLYDRRQDLYVRLARGQAAELVFHSVWQDGQGFLHDISPQSVEEAEQAPRPGFRLFAPDPKRWFDFQKMRLWNSVLIDAGTGKKIYLQDGRPVDFPRAELTNGVWRPCR